MKQCEYSKRLLEIEYALECGDKIKLLSEPLLLYSLRCVIDDRIDKLGKDENDIIV